MVTMAVAVVSVIVIARPPNYDESKVAPYTLEPASCA